MDVILFNLFSIVVLSYIQHPQISLFLLIYLCMVHMPQDSIYQFRLLIYNVFVPILG